MKLRHSSIVFASCLAAAFTLVGAARAQSVSTDPVGAVTLTLQGNSDTLVSLPFHRPVALETTVQNVSGNIINISPSANLTANQFVYQAGTQPATYYVQFTTGARQGMFYTVTANGVSNLTIDPNNDTGFSGNVSTSDSLRVIPYWTLGTLFPSGQGINGSGNFTIAGRSTEVLLPDNVTPGINRAAASDYYYYNGSASGGAGWRKVGSPLATKFDDAILFPDNFFIVRNNIAGNTSLVLVGAVPMAPFATPISTLSDNVDQDIFIGLPIPANVTLAGSNLQQSGAFAASGNFTLAGRQDLLLVFDAVNPGKNRAAIASFYYYNGTASNGAGWRQVGSPLTTIVDSTQIFLPGQGYVLRKKGTPTPQTTIWTFTPSYLTP